MSPLSKVIGFSMHAEIAYAKKMIRLGAKGYVTKNSPSTEMVMAIDEVLAGNTYICEEIQQQSVVRTGFGQRPFPSHP